MRRLTGLYDGVEHVLLEYDNGVIECPSDLLAVLKTTDDQLPTGPALEAALRVLCGDTVQVREV